MYQLTSWVYAEFDRLEALGYINTAETGMRPWTRAECARLVEEAGQAIELHDSSPWAPTYARLAAEFAPEIKGKQTQPGAWLEDVIPGWDFYRALPLQTTITSRKPLPTTLDGPSDVE
jgi:hypothetical protein